MIVASFGTFGRIWSATARHCVLAASGVSCAKAVAMKAETTPALSGVGQHVAHEVDPAALPGCVEHLGDGRLDASGGVGDDQLDATQPRRISLRRNSVQIGSASDVPTSMPSTSRRPSVLTPTACHC